MPWAYYKDRPYEKRLVEDEQEAIERGMVLETQEEASSWSKRKKQFDNDGVSMSHSVPAKIASRRNKRNEVQPFTGFKTKDGKFLNIAQNREGRRILADHCAEKYGQNGFSIEGDF
jgi:hypothetical protein